MYKIDKEKAMFILNKEYDNTIFVLSKGEGSQMTFAETVATISNLKVKANARDIMLVKSIQNGLDYLLDKLYYDNLYFDKDTLCMINRYVAANENFDNIGGFRKGNIKISGSKNKGIKSSELDFNFYKLKEYYFNTDKNGISEMILCLRLAKSQYFGDGNKRTAQLMMNGLLVTNGYVPLVLNFRDNTVVDALIKYYDNDDILDILKIMLEKQKETTLAYCMENEEIKIKEEYQKDLKFIENEFKYKVLEQEKEQTSSWIKKDIDDDLER